MSAENNFWQWFTENEEGLFNADFEEELFDNLATRLQQVDPHLTFELGSKSSQRDFIISAGGIKSSFPAVESLASSAPQLPRWNVIPFRPRRPLPCVLEIGGVKVSSEDVQFSLLDNGKTAGVRLFIPGFQEQDLNWKQIGYLLLDEALGEFDVESRLGLIKMYPPEASTQEKRYPLSELPHAFDTLVSRLAEKNMAT